ncbi:hypothetical protein BCR39DRAFT_546139 [Naematelia encephala]|uniref:Flavin reductase like domain-containing protein n=1 Tax=Naematelia encephala TaxID=71784 RepID=A0A1Y2AQ17_9TREE|nr:hypothetical protein BCR39DRAFT_546139 [Naematelia encephala]
MASVRRSSSLTKFNVRTRTGIITPRQIFERKMSKHPPFEDVEASRPDFDVDFKHVVTKVPLPGFKPGGGLNNNLPYAKDFEANVGKFITFSAEERKPADIYKLLISSATPRCISFNSTLDENGIGNLAPMSYFNVVSHDPPTIMISVQAGKKHSDGLKDTNHNIKTTKEFAVSIISEPFLEASNYTAIDAPSDIDEWKLSGLTKRKSETIKPPHVAESPVSMECELMHWYDIIGASGETSNTVILGRVKKFHIKEFVLDPADPMKVLVEKLRPMSRLGGISYGRTTQTMEVPRPVWEKVKDTPEVQAALAAEEKWA